MVDTAHTVLISVVMPVYKGDFFQQAVQGILAQTYRHFELIIVDDASPYDFKTEVEKIGDPRLSYHRNEVNIGGEDLSAACRHACSFAKGKYVVLASDDDVYMPTYLEEMVKLAEMHPETSLFSCRVGHIDDQDVLKDAGYPVLPYESALYFIWMHEIKRRHLTLFEWFMRRTTLESVGGLAAMPLAWFSDTKTMFLLAAAGNGGVYFCPRMLATYRDSTVQLSHPSKGLDQKCTGTLAYYAWLEQFLREEAQQLVTNKEDEASLNNLRNGYKVVRRRFMMQLIGYAKGFLMTRAIVKRLRKEKMISSCDVMIAYLKKLMKAIR